MHIILGITGGIAAYKAPLLARLLVKAGHEVQCVTTDHALQFVTPLTLETVSGHKLYSDLFAANNDHTTQHISLKDWSDLCVVAPATASILGKMATGVADDALSTLLLAFTDKPVVMCPAMNTQMWNNPAVQRNIATLRKDGVRFVDPDSGDLACGTADTGRMAEPQKIANFVLQRLQETATNGNTEHANARPVSTDTPSHLSELLPSHNAAALHLQGKVLVTAGPTYERIDAVRFIGNYSTGKMGFAVAEALAMAGAEVTLVAGPTALPTPPYDNIFRVDVESAQEMYDVCMKEFPACRAAILSAAVADFRPAHADDIKIKKKNDTEGMTLTLVQNPDILASLGHIKTAEQRLVGFALETDNEMAYAQHKLEHKNLDFIVLNSLADKGAGFGTDTNKITIIDRNSTVHNFKLKNKKEVALDIVAHLAAMLQ